MKIALAAYECRMNDIEFNIRQTERALAHAGDAELVCFGEAWLQGFSALTCVYETDLAMAISRDSPVMGRLRALTSKYNKALMLGYFEKDGPEIYSSYALIEQGEIVHNYRRITKNWKDYDAANEFYKEGTDTEPFVFHGLEMNTALCGDMWIEPEAFRTNGILIWPVYVNFDLDESEAGEYAKQAMLAAGRALLIDPLSEEPRSRGGAFLFEGGKVRARTELDQEALLIVDI